MAQKKARVLRVTDIAGKVYQPNDLVVGDDKLLKPYEEDGSVDASEGAVAFCEKELSAKQQPLGAKAAAEEKPKA